MYWVDIGDSWIFLDEKFSQAPLPPGTVVLALLECHNCI